MSNFGRTTVPLYGAPYLQEFISRGAAGAPGGGGMGINGADNLGNVPIHPALLERNEDNSPFVGTRQTLAPNGKKPDMPTGIAGAGLAGMVGSGQMAGQAGASFAPAINSGMSVLQQAAPAIQQAGPAAGGGLLELLGLLGGGGNG